MHADESKPLTHADAWQPVLASRARSNCLSCCAESCLCPAPSSHPPPRQLTNFIAQQRPGPLRGGILADDMGLGKTLEVRGAGVTGRGGSKCGHVRHGRVPGMAQAGCLWAASSACMQAHALGCRMREQLASRMLANAAPC